MPRHVPTRLAAACALALVLVLWAAVVAAAKSVPADLRVVVSGGKVLDEESLSTATTKVPTSPKARCFGNKSRGSGKAAKVSGPTAMGLLAQAAAGTSALRPFYVTDAFSFGLGLCTVGGYSATNRLSWYLKVNHKGAEVGGDSLKLKPGDEVLWALAAYPYPNELSLTGPSQATPGLPFQVRVFSYDEGGKRRPVPGATVTAASGPTDSSGRAMVTLVGNEELRATHGKEIPSNALSVCVEICS
ncbi:MAG: hypothetical protein ACHQCF_05580 [Solirubrobacterales bacterium]